MGMIVQGANAHCRWTRHIIKKCVMDTSPMPGQANASVAESRDMDNSNIENAVPGFNRVWTQLGNDGALCSPPVEKIFI